MPFVTVNNAIINCSMGVAPMPLMVLPKGVHFISPAFSIACILDSIPFVNIKPFVLCSSPANPAVMAIIIASLGSVTKGPCLPITLPWIPMAPNVLVRKIPINVQNSKSMCIYGGIIQIQMPGQFSGNKK